MLAWCVLISAACAGALSGGDVNLPDTTPRVDVTCQALDADSLHPIARAMLVVEGVVKTADASGLATFRTPVGDRICVATADGYAPSARTFRAVDGAPPVRVMLKVLPGSSRWRLVLAPSWSMTTTLTACPSRGA